MSNKYSYVTSKYMQEIRAPLLGKVIAPEALNEWVRKALLGRKINKTAYY